MNDIFPVQAPDSVPALAFEDAAGRRRSLAGFAGQPVLLNLWAPWCAACVDELPALSALQARLQATPLKVVAVAIDPDGIDKVRALYAELRVAGLEPFADRTRAVVRGLGLRTIPVTLLIDAQGREIGRAKGAQAWDTPAAAREIADRLGLRLPDPGPGSPTTAGLRPGEVALARSAGLMQPTIASLP